METSGTRNGIHWELINGRSGNSFVYFYINEMAVLDMPVEYPESQEFVDIIVKTGVSLIEQRLSAQAEGFYDEGYPCANGHCIMRRVL